MLTEISLLWFQMQMAADIYSFMDFSVDPCVDFFNFACGNYKNKVTLPDDKASMHLFVQTDIRIKKELRSLLEKEEQPGDPVSTLLTKKFYKSCVDEAALEKEGLDPLKRLLKNYGGWPMVEGKNWNESDYDWMKINARMSTGIGGSNLIRFNDGADYKNSTKRILFVDQASLGMKKREFYLEKNNSKFLEAYTRFMTATAVQLGASDEAAKAEVKDVIAFETALANANVKDEDRRDVNTIYRPMTIKQLKEKYPTIDFKTWFDTVNEDGWKLKDTDEINLSGQPFIEKLPSILANFSVRTVANYQMWDLVNGYVSSLAPSLREHLRQFQEAMSGAPKFKPRWEECMGVTMTYMSLPIGGMYVRKYFDEKTKKELDTMVENIRQSMKDTIDKIDWMDLSTKQNAYKKLENMIQNIAFPAPDIYNETWLMRDYQKVELKDAYLDNKISLTLSSKNRDIKEYFDPINRTEWKSLVAEVNAWYSPKENKMTFPAGILRYSWYSPFAPDYFNYGRIGAVMGHELTHGFDDQGRQFDANGNFELWWSNETLAKFKKGAQCIIGQYGNITDLTTGQNLNGRNTQGENIADNGGVKLSHKAWVQNNIAGAIDPKNKLLPGFKNYTTDQLFFLSYGQIWCTIQRLEARKNQIISDPHSPSTYRVNVPLQNNREFAAAYNCPVGSPMNPAEKCQIW